MSCDRELSVWSMEMSAPLESDPPPQIFACRLDISVRMLGVLAVPLSLVVWYSAS